MITDLSALPAERWPEFSSLLDALLDVHPLARPAWLAGLPSQQADLVELLRAASAIHDQQQAAPAVAQPRLASGPEDDPWTFAAGRSALTG